MHWIAAFMFIVFTCSAAELSPPEVEARLRMALQIARERNDRGLVSAVERLGRDFKNGLPPDADERLREMEGKVGIDPGGWSMAGQPLSRPTAEMTARSRELSASLAEAMQTDDLAKVRAVTSEMLKVLGNQAGVPDGRRPGLKPKGVTLSEAEATKLFLEALKSEGRALRALMAGEPLPDQMMRLYGYVLRAAADIRPFVEKHQPDALPQITQLAQGCAKILLSLQQPDGLFPFPDLRGKNIRFGDMLTRQLESGKVEVKDGWIITADPDGGTQFDVGVCGTALLIAGAEFRQDTWTAAGRRAADWALAQKCCGNFNYNAFSVSLLANAYRTTNDQRYLDAALQKFRVGVAPGLAPNGRWMDSHNARTVYHVIILRALGDLTSVAEAHRAEVDAVARPAIKALLDEFDAAGITVEALPELVTLRRVHPDDSRLGTAVAQMASSLIEKCTDGKQVKMGAQPNQLSAVPGVMAGLPPRHTD